MMKVPPLYLLCATFMGRKRHYYIVLFHFIHYQHGNKHDDSHCTENPEAIFFDFLAALLPLKRAKLKLRRIIIMVVMMMVVLVCMFFFLIRHDYFFALLLFILH